MRAEIVIPRAMVPLAPAVALHTYSVPARLASRIAPGFLVAVPFGDKTAAGVVWAVDASDELDAAGPRRTLREVLAVLLDESLMGPEQRTLAQWLADYYAAPLPAAVRLFMPPGLLRSVRTMLHAAVREDIAAPLASREAGVVLAMAAQPGGVDRAQVLRALGVRRGRDVLRGLVAQGTLSAELALPDSFRRDRTERRVRLVADAETVAAWRAQARARLDAQAGHTRDSERILRQLATLEALERAGDAGWRAEELRRLTRITPAALAMLASGGLVMVAEVARRNDPHLGRDYAQTQALPLTPAQAAALAAIVAGPSERAREHAFVLHGITGSGKTEVYLQALAATLKAGKRAILLVPEIALTPQTMARIGGRFPGQVAVLHSALTLAERQDEWRRIRSGEVSIVVGSRSAIFAPVEDLGLVILDEEHESSYKEERLAPTYHAREVAVRLGALWGASVVMGSATPSVESYARTHGGQFTLLELPERAPVAGSAPALPEVSVIDLRAELRAGNTSILSETLHQALDATLKAGEQAILFLNRRGTAGLVVCRDCGYVAKCERCDVAMTYHATEATLLCHYCGQTRPVPATCPVCWSGNIRYFGIGTEKVESSVKQLFPDARVIRWDRDTARTRVAHEELLHAFATHRADVLVGTQMIAKGLDVPNVTLVGIISADTALFLPDFRAAERAFALLTQVSGRAGRGELPGRVLLQTFNPEHFCVQAAAKHDYATFVEAELAARERFGYPPFRRFAKLLFEHRDRHVAQVSALALSATIERLIRERGLTQADVVGPAPAFPERMRERYRWQLILRAEDPLPLLRALDADDVQGWALDLDPASTL